MKTDLQKNGFYNLARSVAPWFVIAMSCFVGVFLFQANESSTIVASPVPFEPLNSSATANQDPQDDHDFELSNGEQFQQFVVPFLKKYCVECHSGENPEGDADFTQFKKYEQVLSDPDIWSEISDAVGSEYMPPETNAQPTDEERQKLASWVESLIAQSSLPIPQPRTRRLNRVEYENTVNELLELNRNGFYNPSGVIRSTDYFQPETGKMPRYVLAMSYFTYGHRRLPVFPGVSSPPSDPPVEHGFSNDQTSLSISPLLLETYFELANGIVNSPSFPRVSRLWNEMFAHEPWRWLSELRQHGEQQLTGFLQRAFRRPPGSQELDSYLGLFNTKLDETGSYQKAMKTTVAAILVSPGFLFRDDLAQSTTAMQQHADFAMASRLSYFLWGTMPDDELFEAARNGQLRQPAEISAQVERMMKDRKIKSLSTDFGAQWLRLAKVNSAIPDKDLFKEYYRKRIAPQGVSMMIEQLLLFETIMIEDRSILDFIDADFSYVNRHLMDWYQLKPKKVLGYTPNPNNFEDFFRIKWPNKNRGGIITSGAMLLSTSTTTRSSPVYRGSWILDVVFNRPPPPAPAAVPPLDDVTSPEEAAKNVREKLERHRLDPACASCHDRMDPPGFALEKFDAVGRWRAKYDDGTEIDASGEIFGAPFLGPQQFKKAIMKNNSRFVRGFVEHMMRYAIGRKLEVADQPEIERITQEVIRQDYRFSVVVQQIVSSKQFTMTKEFSGQQVSSR